MQQQPFDAAMLIPEGNLQVQNFLAVALKAEMPRFDDARMDRPNRYLVYLLAFHAVERIVAGDGLLRIKRSPGRRRHHLGNDGNGSSGSRDGPGVRPGEGTAESAADATQRPRASALIGSRVGLARRPT